MPYAFHFWSEVWSLVRFFVHRLRQRDRARARREIHGRPHDERTAWDHE
jgi:hypothetical protein